MKKAWFDRWEEEVSRLSAIDEELAAPLVELLEERRNTMVMMDRYRSLLTREGGLTKEEWYELKGLCRWVKEVYYGDSKEEQDAV